MPTLIYILVLSAGVSPPPGAVLVLHSLPLEFPLAMAFAEQLLTYTVGETIDRSEDELDTVPTSVLMQVVELLGEKCSFFSEDPRKHIITDILNVKCTAVPT